VPQIAGFNQEMFFNFLKTFECIHKVLELKFTPKDLKKFLLVVNGFLTYAYADVDYLKDAQNLTRLQAFVFSLLDKFDVGDPAVRSVLLLEFIDFMNLPYQRVSTQEVPSSLKNPEGVHIPQAAISSYISFSVVAMDKLVECFTTYVHEESLYTEEIFDKIILVFGPVPPFIFFDPFLKVFHLFFVFFLGLWGTHEPQI